MADHKRVGAPYAVLLIVAVAAAVGCNGSNGLTGRWVGKPDTSEARAARWAIAEGEDSPDATLDPADEGNNRRTDWESLDAEVHLEFTSTGEVQMTLNGGDPVEGTWRVISVGPAAETIEISTPGVAEEPAGEEDSSSKPKPVRRRFEVVPELKDGVMTGFLFSEVGADPDLGVFYFRREE